MEKSAKENKMLRQQLSESKKNETHCNTELTKLMRELNSLTNQLKVATGKHNLIEFVRIQQTSTRIWFKDVLADNELLNVNVKYKCSVDLGFCFCPQIYFARNLS